MGGKPYGNSATCICLRLLKSDIQSGLLYLGSHFSTFVSTRFATLELRWQGLNRSFGDTKYTARIQPNIRSGTDCGKKRMLQICWASYFSKYHKRRRRWQEHLLRFRSPHISKRRGNAATNEFMVKTLTSKNNNLFSRSVQARNASKFQTRYSWWKALWR